MVVFYLFSSGISTLLMHSYLKHRSPQVHYYPMTICRFVSVLSNSCFVHLKLGALHNLSRKRCNSDSEAKPLKNQAFSLFWESTWNFHRILMSKGKNVLTVWQPWTKPARHGLHMYQTLSYLSQILILSFPYPNVILLQSDSEHILLLSRPYPS